MFYPAHVLHEDDGYTVSFRDIPEALTCGSTLEEALINAQGAIVTAMEFYFEDNRVVPYPSKAQEDEYLVELPPSVTAKVFLLNLMLEKHVSNAELARRLNTKPQEVQRIVSLSHTTKIDTMSKAIKALGKQLQLSIS